jgi:hypothetical protein
MATNQATTTGTTEDQKKIVTEFQNIEAQRAAGLGSAASLIDINSTVMATEQKRLMAKYGADDPRVINITAKIATRAQMRPSLDTEITRASQQPVVISKESVGALQGTVYDASGKPTPDTTVYIADTNGQLLSDQTNVCSNAAGYYNINFDKETAKALKSKAFYVRASDVNKNVIYSDTTAFILTPNKITFKNIFINAKVCTPPPSSSNDDKPPHQG